MLSVSKDLDRDKSAPSARKSSFDASLPLLMSFIGLQCLWVMLQQEKVMKLYGKVYEVGCDSPSL